MAYLKPATQSNDETYGGFNWTAAYAVEGCTDRDSLVGQTCCSTAIPIEGQEPATYWSVDLLGLYSIDLIKIFGRSGMAIYFYCFSPKKMDFFLLETTFKISINLNTFTVKTLYNVTLYNNIFNIRHKIAGNGSVSSL